MGTFNTDDLYFWTGFYNDEDCFSWASKKAYLDMNRTMTFRETANNDASAKEKEQIQKQREGWRDRGTEIIKNKIQALPKDFSVWHEEVCDALRDIYDPDHLVERKGTSRTDTPARLTYGQAQKWLNMTLKYLWLLDRLGLIEDKDTCAFIHAHERSFHVPLDSYILRYAARQNKGRKEPFDKHITDNGLNAAIPFQEEWSKISDYRTYAAYQKSLHDQIKTAYGSPLEWELVHWHQALKYYG